MRKNEDSEIRIEQVKKYLDEGLSQREISIKLGLTPGTVSLYCSKHKLTGVKEERICVKCGQPFEVLKSLKNTRCDKCKGNSRYVKARDRDKEGINVLELLDKQEKEIQQRMLLRAKRNEELSKVVVGSCSSPLTHAYYSMFAKW